MLVSLICCFNIRSVNCKVSCCKIIESVVCKTMAPRKTKNVLLMVTNVGKTSLEQNDIEDEPFIDKAKLAMRLLVEKKIFLQPNDEIGIITMGDETTDNPEGMDYVKNYKDHLLVPNWEMVRYINDLNASNNPCNWVEALHVALNFKQREVVDPAYVIFLVIFNNFNEPKDAIDSYDSEVIVNDIKNCGDIHLLFIGENPLNNKGWRKVNATYSEKLAMKIMRECAGQYEQINSFIEERRFYLAPAINAMPWKFDLEVADLCIPCSSYVKINEDVKVESWKMKALNDTEDLLNTAGDMADTLPSDNNVAKIVKVNLKLDAQRNEVHETINGYKFGGQYIPVSKEDEEAMKYEGGPKSMSVYGFVSQDDIKLEHWCGKGSRVIVPQGEDIAPALYSLVKAMVENEYVAIVRKVHANNYMPRMGVLFPRVDEDDVWCLVHLELPYDDELRFIDRKPIKSLSKDIPKDKLDALDNWIDSMTVPQEEMIYLNPGFFPNVPHQYHWNAMADRAVNPSNPLIRLPEYLQKYVIPPEQLIRKAKYRLDKLNTLFGWSNEPVVKKKRTTAPVVVHATAKARDDVNIAVIEKKDKTSTDEEFFSPEDIDMETGELDSM